MRLARENGWTPTFAERVIEEYKRFVYLAMVAGHPVTPSDEVDQAWHLHMLYTESYFDRLCDELLGKKLSHGPTRGGKSEGPKFEDWYERTKRSYQEEFGTEPPSDIWPASEKRFGDAPYFQRINVRENIVVPRRKVKLALVALGALFAIVLVQGCSQLPVIAQVGEITGVLLVLFTILVVVAIVILIKNSRGGGSGFGGCSGSGCSSGSSGCGSSGCSGCGGGCGGCGGD
jgi:hypothetical protein